jgi:hypothetical protein
MFNSRNLVIAVLAVFLLGGFVVGKSYFQNKKEGAVESTASRSEKVVIFKSPTCGCCVGYSAYLEDQGFEVEVVNQEDITSVKDEHNIPFSMQSCHTAIIGDYFVEGHVPVEAIDKLLSEKPDIDGIALPDMPAGSPGMPGVKSEEFVIYSLNSGDDQEFVRL